MVNNQLRVQSLDNGELQFTNPIRISTTVCPEDLISTGGTSFILAALQYAIRTDLAKAIYSPVLPDASGVDILPS